MPAFDLMLVLEKQQGANACLHTGLSIQIKDAPVLTVSTQKLAGLNLKLSAMGDGFQGIPNRLEEICHDELASAFHTCLNWA